METQRNVIKRGRGGKRLGAGRKPDYFKRLATKPLTAAEILAQFDEREAWARLLTHENAEIQLKARVYLTDRQDGKAKQAVEVSGGLVHAHTAYRNPALAALSNEEVQQLDAITRKLLPAAVDGSGAAQDGPHNQIESNRATQAVEMDLQDLEDANRSESPSGAALKNCVNGGQKC